MELWSLWNNDQPQRRQTKKAKKIEDNWNSETKLQNLPGKIAVKEAKRESEQT